VRRSTIGLRQQKFLNRANLLKFLHDWKMSDEWTQQVPKLIKNTLIGAESLRIGADLRINSCYYHPSTKKRHVTTGATSFASLLFKHNHATPIDNFSSTTNNTQHYK
jgi:hypothetical protein